METNVLKFNNFLSAEDISNFLDDSPNTSTLLKSPTNVKIKHFSNIDIVNLVESTITERVGSFYKSYYQSWGAGSSTSLHNHVEPAVYIAVIYLNDNFNGGEFFTENETIAPEPGLMLFFDGELIPHGVNEVLNGTRKTMVIYWNKS
jgi:hypothetical protein